jgi:DNA (cytosine-5)-methyltransferase 1
VVDLFAGGGGASTGIEAALGRQVDIAINHSATALAVHKANHPLTQHLTADIWEVKPREATRGRPVEVLWASPDCTHFSVAKGGTPRQKNIRSLAEVVVEWAQAVRPRVIFVENVAEFRGWGPLGDDGRPIKARMGELFERWSARLELLGYAVEHRILDASLYGAPTRRRRLFIVARCDGEPIRWPEPTHGPGRLPLRTAAECIDWSLPCPSIFERKRPLAEKTLRRIALGIQRFVLENPRPFVVGIDHQSSASVGTAVDEPLSTVTAKARHAVVSPFIAKVNHGEDAKTGPRVHGPQEPLTTVTASARGHAVVAPTLIQTGYGERPGQRPRHLDLHEPLGTVVAQGQKHALVAAFLAKHYGGVVGAPFDGRPMDTITATDHHSLVTSTLVKLRGECHGADVEEPLPTVTASGNHLAEVRAFLTTYYGSGSTGQAVDKPLRTITSLARLGLVLVEGVEHQIIDIGMRMLEPHELLRAQFGKFAEAYDMSAATSKAEKVRLIGNSVCPEVAEALVRANLGELAAERRAA